MASPQVSLGFFEKDDLATVVQHLRDSGEVSTVGLWGRSMGAATALLHAHRDHSIAAMVLDSPFSSLQTLARELVDKGKAQGGITVPGFVVNIILGWVRGSVKKKANFDVNDLTPIARAGESFTPALFVAGQDDDFIAPTHSQSIHDAYAGDKNLSLVSGGHNSPRPDWWLKAAAVFLQTRLQIPEHLALRESPTALPAAGYAGAGDTIVRAWGRARAMQGVPAPPSQSTVASAEEDMIRRAMAVSLMVGGGSMQAPPTSTAVAAAAGPDAGPDAAHGASKDAPSPAAVPPPVPPSGADVSPAPCPDLHTEMLQAQAGLSEEEMLAMALAASAAGE